LSPGSPELNPVENIWQFMRENWLSNRTISSYQQIPDIRREAWNKRVEQPWKIMSIDPRNRVKPAWPHRQWALDRRASNMTHADPNKLLKLR
jgi:hypothetical protein